MKILHVYKTSLPATVGGVETFIDNLCKKTQNMGVENVVFTLNRFPNKNNIKMDGYTVIQEQQHIYVASTGFSFSAFKKFNNLASEADILHYHFPNPFADVLHLLCAPKKPSLITYHSDITKQKNLLRLYKPMMYQFLNKIDHIVATSPNYVSTSDTLKRYINKVSVIPLGIEPNFFETIDKERFEYWRKKFEGPFFLFVGAMRYYKGLHLLIEAVSNTNIQVVLAGGGATEGKLKAQVAKLGLKNVKFVGQITNEDKNTLLSLCCGFVFPSHLRSEAFGIALVEAAMHGKALVSAENGTGTSYVNVNGETGIVVERNSSKALREALQFLLANPNRAARMGQNARARALEHFTAERQSHSYLQIYERLFHSRLT